MTIRRWAVTDAAEMSALIEHSLDHLRGWMAWADHEPLDQATRHGLIRAWDRYWESGAGAVYGIFVEDLPLGGCALHRRVGAGGLDIGYWLGRLHVGHGHATTAVQALIDAAFAMDDIGFVEISHHSSNTASGSVAIRLGFTPIDSPTTTDATAPVTVWRLNRPAATIR